MSSFATPCRQLHRQQAHVGRRARMGVWAGRQCGRAAGRRGRHEGGVEPLALSCSTDLKSAPRTDEDHHGLLAARRRAQIGKPRRRHAGVNRGSDVPRRQPGPSIENKQYAGPELRPIAKQRRSASFETPARTAERGEARAVVTVPCRFDSQCRGSLEPRSPFLKGPREPILCGCGHWNRLDAGGDKRGKRGGAGEEAAR